MPLYGHIGPRRLVRTFVAIPTPGDIVRRLMKLSQQFEWPGCKVRWSSAEQFHLTVQFLGNVEWIEVGKIGKTITEVAAEFPPLTLRLDKLAVFPPQNQPRVLVAALEPNELLGELVETMQQALQEDHSIVPEKRAYKPHITLGRVKSVADREAGERLRADLAAVESELLQSWGEWEADELTFFQSDLDGGRAEYIELCHAPLAAGADEGDEGDEDDEAGEAGDEAARGEAANVAPKTGRAAGKKSRGGRGVSDEDRSVAALIARGGDVDRDRTRNMLAFHEEEPADAEFEIDLDGEDEDEDEEADFEAESKGDGDENGEE